MHEVWIWITNTAYLDLLWLYYIKCDIFFLASAVCVQRPLGWKGGMFGSDESGKRYRDLPSHYWDWFVKFKKKKDRDWLDEPSICSSSPTSSIKRGGVIFKFLLSLYFVPTSIYSSSPTSSIKRWGVIFKFLLSLYFVPVSIIYVSRSYNRYSHMNWFIQV